MLNQLARAVTRSMTCVPTLALAIGVAVAGGLAAGVVAAQSLYLTLAVGDLEIYEVTLSDGSSPTPIDPNADGYEVLLPEGSTLGTFSGAAEVAGAASTSSGGAAAATSSAEATAISADSPAGGDPIQAPCPTDWIELETYSAAFYYFSPDGADEGPSWSAEPPSLFIRCRVDGRVVVWIGQPGTSPPTI